MCDSINKGIKCRHGDKCRFAHDKKELVIKACLHGDNCRNITVNKNGIYFNNKKENKICQYKHKFETEENCRNRNSL